MLLVTAGSRLLCCGAESLVWVLVSLGIAKSCEQRGGGTGPASSTINFGFDILEKCPGKHISTCLTQQLFNACLLRAREGSS